MCSPRGVLVDGLPKLADERNLLCRISPFLGNSLPAVCSTVTEASSSPTDAASTAACWAVAASPNTCLAAARNPPPRAHRQLHPPVASSTAAASPRAGRRHLLHARWRRRPHAQDGRLLFGTVSGGVPARRMETSSSRTSAAASPTPREASSSRPSVATSPRAVGWRPWGSSSGGGLPASRLLLQVALLWGFLVERERERQ